ncbi:MAG TPA: YkgJ family cysteine cluster protein [Sedimentisphaerales bacterium]|nr:YkgJ family cysteine cluster protein [Sedimentisphaerales bacterium]
MQTAFALSLGSLPKTGRVVSCRLEVPEPLDFHIRILHDRARISDLVPVARQISDTVSRLTQRQSRLSGNIIPCRKGCAACCRFLVPVSAAEAACIIEEILSLPPAPKEEVLSAFLKTAGSLLAAEPLADYSSPTISGWYRGMEMDCPLLKENICMMYESRPLACREHLAAGKVDGPCHKSEMTTLEMPVSLTCALADVTAAIEKSEPEALMLPLALPWYEGSAARATKLWRADELADEFVEAVVQQSIRAAVR